MSPERQRWHLATLALALKQFNPEVPNPNQFRDLGRVARRGRRFQIIDSAVAIHHYPDVTRKRGNWRDFADKTNTH